jgi:predicted TIM-barrel fold metal-dependent hydrolase
MEHDRYFATGFEVPPGSWDSHAHVIAATGYRFIESRSYTPEPAPESEYLAMLDSMGMTFGVLVQVSVYGTDNRYLLHVLERNRQRLRGVAVVTSDVSDAELEQMHAVGVRGVRINALYGGGASLDALEPLAERIAPFGWHLQIYMDASLLSAVARRMRELPCPVVLDHLAHTQANLGVQHDGFKQLLSVAQADNVWVKLSAANRLSQQPDYGDTVPIARALIEASPNRLIWGSDWPHVACASRPQTAQLKDLLAAWAPNPNIREKILVENPRRLYGLPG